MTDKERIESEAREYCKGSPQFIFEYRGFIAGAKWRNNAVIDEAIEATKGMIGKYIIVNKDMYDDFIELLESLKIKP